MFQGNESIGGRAFVESEVGEVKPIEFSAEEYKLLFSLASADKKARAALFESKEIELGQIVPLLKGAERHLVLIDREGGAATDLSVWDIPLDLADLAEWLAGE